MSIPTVRQATDQLRTNCRTSNASYCTTKMAGYLHGLLKELSFVPKNFQYSVIEVVFGCEIYTFSQLRFETCKALIDGLTNNPDYRALFLTIFDSIKAKVGQDHDVVPGEFKDFLFVCGNEGIYPNKGTGLFHAF